MNSTPCAATARPRGKASSRASSGFGHDRSVAPTEAAAQRILDVARRPAEAGIIVAGGGRPAFRFDGAGRVIERRELTDAESAQALSTLETRVVGGARFAIVSSGELAGWALAEDAHLQFVPLTGGAQPAG